MNEEISIGDLVNTIAELFNVKIEIETEDKRVRPKKSEVERLICNNDKIIKNTNWKPSYNLKKGIVETIEWIKENLNLYKPNIYNV